MEERKCLYCRKIFQTDIPGKKYCCRKCSVKSVSYTHLWRGEEPKDLSAAADMAFIFIRTKMDMETEARKEYCRKQQERGKLGGRPKKNPEESKEKK